MRSKTRVSSETDFYANGTPGRLWGHQTRDIRQIAGRNPRLSHAHQPCDADTQKSVPRYTPANVNFIAECRNNPHSLLSEKSCLDSRALSRTSTGQKFMMAQRRRQPARAKNNFCNLRAPRKDHSTENLRRCPTRTSCAHSTCPSSRGFHGNLSRPSGQSFSSRSVIKKHATALHADAGSPGQRR